MVVMLTKDGRQQQEGTIHPYELTRLAQCMNNNARLRELGLLGEGAENTSKDTTKASKKITNNRPAKRAHAAEPTTRVTRSKKSFTLQHAEGDVPSQAIVTAQVNGTAETAIDSLAQEHEEGPIDAESEGGEGRCIRGTNMGKALQKLSRARRGKLALIIPKGKIRPLAPLVAAKFATECNIAVRNHVPVLKRWKEYKNKPGHFDNFIGKVGAKFDMNTNSEPIRKACLQMMKSAIRQQRYRLKKKYFDPFPLNMETCQKNKANRAKVKFHQTTGSRSYEVHCENLGDKYNDEDPNALDLFKECHYSKKKKCYTPSVQSAINEMEKRIAEATDIQQEDEATDAQQENEASDVQQEHMPVTKVVADVLAEHTQRNKFLQNVGMQDVQPRASDPSLQKQLAEEKRANIELRSVVNSQREEIGVLSKQVQESEQARVKDKEEMQKKQAETDAKLDFLLSQLRSAEPVR